MESKVVTIRGLDTTLFRDGRPFDATPGGLARGQTVPFPSTLAGFLRSHILRPSGDYSRAGEISVRGPLFVRDEEIMFPAPADIVPYEKGGKLQLMPLRPFAKKPEDAGCDIPGGMLPVEVTQEFKPAEGYNWWKMSLMHGWLEGQPPDASGLEKEPVPALDQRVHIVQDIKSGTTEEGKLFTTSMTAFEHLERRNGMSEHTTWSYLCQTQYPDDLSLEFGPGLLGGEQRIGIIEETAAVWPICPDNLKEKLNSLKSGNGVRMILATPAIFTFGWLPGWLDNTSKEGTPPGLAGLTLKLVSACVPRRQAVSGWDMVHGLPKPVRWLAPAGSVYFFEVTSANASTLADEGWLRPVSDEEETREPNQPAQNNQNDGFGLALWGV